MTLHRLKTWPQFYLELLHGKNWELRKNDRSFKTGDCLDLCEWDPKTAAFTGQHQVREVLRVTALDDLGPQFKRWVMLSLREGT